MKTVAVLIAASLAASGVQAQSAPDYVRVSPDRAPSGGRAAAVGDNVVYWNRARVLRDGDQVEVELRFVTRGLGATRPMNTSRHYRISCEWGLQSFPVGSPPAEREVWSTPRFINSAALLAVSEQVCGSAPATEESPGFPTEEAAYEDGVMQLGFESLEAALRLPAGGAFISSAPPSTPAPAGDEPEGYDLAYGPDGDHRAVFLKQPRPTAPGSAIEGRSVWLMGVGRPSESRSFAIRDYRADCATGQITVASVRSWPLEGRSHGPIPGVQISPTLSGKTPAPGSASDALLDAICSGPGKGVFAATMEEVVAYAESPAEDPAFGVLSREMIGADDMRWTRVADAETVSAAYPQGALQPGETGLTRVACVVTREYALTACAPTYYSPHDRGLQEAHMTLIGQYAPARASATGADTMGRRAEFAIRWSSAGSAPEPQLIRSEDMIWARVPSRDEIRRVRGERGPATGLLMCDISAEHRLTNCTGDSWMGTNGRSLTTAIKALSHVFEAAPTTRSGEPTAGRRILVAVRADE